MRYIILLVVLFSCMEEGLKKECSSFCFKMTISDSTPIQFWINGEPTFNESNPICGLTDACFCQPFNCDDEITIQLEEATGSILYLSILNTDDEEIGQVAFTEVSDGVFQLSFTPSDLSICEKVRFSIFFAESEFVSQVSAADNNWRSVVYGNGLYVAVASSGTGNRVMTSPDGVTWTIRVSAADNAWQSVTFGNGLFVATATTGTGNRVMTSPDGITWTLRTSAADIQWIDVTYGNGLFVAVSNSGTTNRVMTSPDGITWTIRTTPNFDFWAVKYGNGIFAAVGDNALMTSPDGITWTLRVSPPTGTHVSIAYGNGLFVSVATGLIYTSPDGINWTSRTSPSGNDWQGVTFGGSFFVAVSATGTGDRAMISSDGITWDSVSSSADNSWQSITYNDGLFVAVAASGTGDRVMTLDLQSNEVASSDCIDLRNNHECSKLLQYTNADDFDGITYDISPQPTFYLRVPAQLLEDENPQTAEDLELSNGTIVTVRQTIQEKSIFKLGYMPPYMHTKVQKVLMHDTVIIDDIQWKRRDAYEAPRVEDYPLKKGEVLLTKYNSVLKNTI